MCMECEVYTENGHGGGRLRQEFRPQNCKQEDTGTSELRLGFPSSLAGPSRRQMYPTAADRHPAAPPLIDDASTEPFMSNMDEISYWIYTKRAPCLMNYDNLIKKQYEEAHCSKKNQKSVHEVPSSKKKKKRKLSILDDESLCIDKQQNVYFDVSQQNNKKIVISSKSDSNGSDIDFNIKNSSIQCKRKRTKLQKTSRTTIHKKNKIVTSTPKVTSLRRSLRQAQQTLNNSHLNMSFVFQPEVINGSNVKNNVTIDQSAAEELKPSREKLAGGDQSDNKKNATTNNKVKHNGVNGQFEDLSDMSGFTANYIRSTKVQSNKTPRKLRCKTARNLVKESKPSTPKASPTLVCVNKSVNATHQKTTMLNCSTDSSQNVIKLVTTKDNDKSNKMNKSTSPLKFVETKAKGRESVNKPRNNVNLNISFQSSTSRYPKRTKVTRTVTNDQANNEKKVSKNSSEFDNSDRKENPEDKIISRTRSGRSLGLTLRQPENTVLVLSNSTEQVSSMVSLNVASPHAGRERVKKKKRVLNRTVGTRSKLSQKDLTKDKSGFAACFSDSDNDSEPLQRKFFCT